MTAPPKDRPLKLPEASTLAPPAEAPLKRMLTFEARDWTGASRVSLALSTLRMKPPSVDWVAAQTNLVIIVTVKCSLGLTLSPRTWTLKAPPGAFGMSTRTSFPAALGIDALLWWTVPAGSVMIRVIALPG